MNYRAIIVGLQSLAIVFLLTSSASRGQQQQSNGAGNANSNNSTQFQCGWYEWPNVNRKAYRSSQTVVASKRISSGSPAQLRQFPSTVLVVCKAGATARYCGGTLVAADRVATAAHCIDARESCTIRAGLVDQVRGKHAQTARVTGFCSHKLHRKARFAEYDFAILKLDHKLALNANVQLVCIIGGGAAWTTGPTNNETLYAVGFGRFNEGPSNSDFLNYIAVSRTNCPPKGPKMNSCYVSTSKGDICQGDSGSGLYMFRNNRQYLAGVVSSKLVPAYMKSRCSPKSHGASHFFDVFKESNEVARLIQHC